MSPVRIAATGLGLVTPLGLDAATTWSALIQGKVAGRWLEETAVETTPGWRMFGAPVIDTWIDHNPHQSRSTRFVIHAATEAIQQAGLNENDLRNTGCVIGTSKPDLRAIDEWFRSLDDSNSVEKREGLPILPSEPAIEVANQFGVHGPVSCPVAACATGLVSLIQAANLIRSGVCSRVICGSTDSSLHPGLLASYRRLGVLADPGENPANACRPFDENRCGFLVGEGAAIFVLEEWETAQDRGAVPLAEWIDGQIGNDPTGITSIDPNGESLAELIRRLLDRNHVSSDQIHSLCYHATATQLNDQAEANAMQQVFGEKNIPPGFGIKGAIGHLMGAAGAVETAVGILALQNQILSPTTNYTKSDPTCVVPVSGTPMKLHNADYLLKTSLGFGGHLAAGLLKRV